MVTSVEVSDEKVIPVATAPVTQEEVHPAKKTWKPAKLRKTFKGKSEVALALHDAHVKEITDQCYDRLADADRKHTKQLNALRQSLVAACEDRCIEKQRGDTLKDHIRRLEPKTIPQRDAGREAMSRLRAARRKEKSSHEDTCSSVRRSSSLSK